MVLDSARRGGPSVPKGRTAGVVFKPAPDQPFLNQGETMPEDFHIQAENERKKVVAARKKTLEDVMRSKGHSQDSMPWEVIMLAFDYGVMAGQEGAEAWYQMYGCYP